MSKFCFMWISCICIFVATKNGSLLLVYRTEQDLSKLLLGFSRLTHSLGNYQKQHIFELLGALYDIQVQQLL